MLDDVMARIVIAMSRGMCFLPQPSFFTEDVFAYFDATDMLTEESKLFFEKLFFSKLFWVVNIKKRLHLWCEYS